MKTMIAIPARSTMPTKTVQCLERLRRLPDTYTSFVVDSLVHDARNEFASAAILKGFDRVLWLDSDMAFDDDLLIRMSQTMDEKNIHMLCGLYFKRVLPTSPVIYCRQERNSDPVHGEYITPVAYEEYPKDALFQVDACGFGAVMTDVALLKAVWDKYGPPFSYYLNLGEDLSFCWRVREMGASIWCDSRLKVGHIGQIVFGEETWNGQKDHD